jgi:hypothetical protein
MTISPYKQKPITFETMYNLTGTILTFGYLALFLFLIPRMNFFRIGNIPTSWFQGVFVLKVLSGFLLYLIYTYYYTDRSTADIWKYYDDGMVMYSALHEYPVDYFKMLFGVMNDTSYFQPYYDEMNHWYRPYGSSIANDTHTIIRFNAFVRLFSLGHYNVHSVIANFLGLLGLTGILHFLKQMAPRKEKWFFTGIFLMPGMMFWASGVLKEPLLFFGLGLFLYGVIRLANDGFSIGKLTIICLSLFFLFTVKSYVLIAIIPGLLAWQLSIRIAKISPAIVFAVVYGLLVVAVIALGQFMPSKDPLQRLVQKQNAFYQLAEGGTYVKTNASDTLYIDATDYDFLEFSEDRAKFVMKEEVKAVYWKDAKQETAPSQSLVEGRELAVLLDYGRTGSTIKTPRLEPTFWSVLKASPIALTNATFRPFPWEIRSLFMALSGLENILIVVLLILAIVGAYGHTPLPSSATWFLALSFALVILILTGLVTPVLGAIVRYKVPALPFLVCALLALIDTEWLERKFELYWKRR